MNKRKVLQSDIQSLLERASVFHDSEEICDLLRSQGAASDGYSYVENEAASHIEGLWSYTLELCEALKSLTNEPVDLVCEHQDKRSHNDDELLMRFDQIERE